MLKPLFGFVFFCPFQLMDIFTNNLAGFLVLTAAIKILLGPIVKPFFARSVRCHGKAQTQGHGQRGVPESVIINITLDCDATMSEPGLPDRVAQQALLAGFVEDSDSGWEMDSPNGNHTRRVFVRKCRQRTASK